MRPCAVCVSEMRLRNLVSSCCVYLETETLNHIWEEGSWSTGFSDQTEQPQIGSSSNLLKGVTFKCNYPCEKCKLHLQVDTWDEQGTCSAYCWLHFHFGWLCCVDEHWYIQQAFSTLINNPMSDLYFILSPAAKALTTDSAFRKYSGPIIFFTVYVSA